MTRFASLAAAGIAPCPSRPGTHRRPCPECAKGARDDALAITMEPGGHAVWFCHRCGWKGALGQDSAADDPDRGFAPRRSTMPPAPPDPEQLRTLADRHAAAMRLWRSCLPLTPACPVANYLRARSCPLPHPDGDLRYLKQHRHPSGYAGSALIALVTDAVTAEPMTLHRTWIRADGKKADVDKPRLLWPGLPKAGGVVRLSPDTEVTLGLCIAEGIETALSAAAGFGLAWATVDSGNMAAFPVLPGIDGLTIIADHDRPNPKTGISGGLAAALLCEARWRAAGVEAGHWFASEIGQDFNDYAQGMLAG